MTPQTSADVVQLVDLVMFVITTVVNVWFFMVLKALKHPFAEAYGKLPRLGALESDFEKLTFANREWTLQLKCQLWRKILGHYLIYWGRLTAIFVAAVVLIFESLVVLLVIYLRATRSQVDGGATQATSASAPMDLDQIQRFLDWLFQSSAKVVLIPSAFIFTVCVVFAFLLRADAAMLVGLLRGRATGASASK